MNTRHHTSFRAHLPLVLGAIGASALLALITAIIVTVNSAPAGWYWSH